MQKKSEQFIIIKKESECIHYILLLFMNFDFLSIE